MPVTRLPLVLNIEQRNATQDKDSELINAFIDKSESGVVYVIKRPGFAVGAEGITTGTNRGIFHNPYNDTFYYIDNTNQPQPVSFSPPPEQEWITLGTNIASSAPIVEPSPPWYLSGDIFSYPFGNNWFQLVGYANDNDANVYYSITTGNLDSNTPWSSLGDTPNLLNGIFQVRFHFGDEIYAGWSADDEDPIFKTIDGVNWTFIGINGQLPIGGDSIPLSGAGSSCLVPNHNCFKIGTTYYTFINNLSTNDSQAFYQSLTDWNPPNPVEGPPINTVGFPSGRTLTSTCKFGTKTICYITGATTSETDVYSSTDLTTFIYEGTIPVGARVRSNSTELNGSLYYSVRPTQTDSTQVYKSNGADLSTWEKIPTNDPKGYIITKKGSVLYSIFPKGYDGTGPCLVDTYKYD